ncbi:MAG: hydantoinase/oxoprolinase family protein [Hyphomicrobiaceae bacterium]
MQQFGLGIDIGGTFTDIVLYDTITGRQESLKELTTHGDPSLGVMSGIDRLLAETAIRPADIGRVVHATTLFTNAVIERRGAVTGLLTTTGFRDTLEIGRERKYELYDIRTAKPRPLVPRHLRLEVTERMDVRGQVVTPLDDASVTAAADQLVAQGVTSLAVVYLHSYANPAHERRTLNIITRRHPKLALSASIDVAPEIREYERTSTTVINAYVRPLAERYLGALATEINARNITAPLLLMLSNGGLTNLDEAKRSPVQLLESGPAAGALVAAHLGREEGGAHVLAFDMGGTTAKLSVIDDGKPSVAYSFEAAREQRFTEGSGLPVRISALELIEIGAGGGSIAHLDEIGLLKVGPISAGSEPGPASYGLGGKNLTVTDADFLLGFLNPAYFAGGRMTIDMAAATEAASRLAATASLERIAAAWGVHDLVNENMANAARVHIAEHGKDPRRYTLLCTGGAGPVHAYHVARKLGLKRLIAPRAAGVASALGLIVAPARVDRVATIARDFADIVWPDLEATYARLEAEAKAVLDATLPETTTTHVTRLADIRYVGQASELVVPLPPGPYTPASRAALVAAFEAAYVASFTRTPPTSQVEIINARVSSIRQVEGGAFALQAVAPTSGNPKKGQRDIYFPDFRTHRPTPVYDRAALAVGVSIQGPAVIEEASSTLVVGPGGCFTLMPTGNIVVEIG